MRQTDAIRLWRGHDGAWWAEFDGPISDGMRDRWGTRLATAYMNRMPAATVRERIAARNPSAVVTIDAGEPDA